MNLRLIVSFARSYLSPEKNFININFVVALMLALIVFIVGIDWSSNRVRFNHVLDVVHVMRYLCLFSGCVQGNNCSIALLVSGSVLLDAV